MNRFFNKNMLAGISAFLWSAAAPALAQEPIQDLGAETPDLFMAGLKMAGAMVLLLATLFFLVYMMKRLNASKSGFFSGRELIRLLATKALAPKKYIVVVEVGGSVLTLGVTSDNISCLDKTPAEDFKAFIEEANPVEQEKGFARRLKALAGSGTPEAESSIK